jgi:hypothetical protein
MNLASDLLSRGDPMVPPFAPDSVELTYGELLKARAARLTGRKGFWPLQTPASGSNGRHKRKSRIRTILPTETSDPAERSNRTQCPANAVCSGCLTGGLVVRIRPEEPAP